MKTPAPNPQETIPLKRCTTVEGVVVNGGNTRTIVKGGPGLAALELDYLPQLGLVRVKLAPRPAILVPLANIAMMEPEK